MSQETTETASAPAPESLVDPETLADRDDVTVDEEHIEVDQENFEMLADLDDLAPIGLTTDDRAVLVTRVTDTCSQKIPCSAVGPNEDFVAQAREWVEGLTGLNVTIDGIAGCWRLDATHEDDGRTTTRHFVAFAASPASEDLTLETAPEDEPDHERAVDAGWYESVPEGAEEVPGTEIFFDG